MRAAMEHGSYKVVYLDRRAREETVRKDSGVGIRASAACKSSGGFKFDSRQNTREIEATIDSILSTFFEVHVCRTAKSCLSKLCELSSCSSITPTLLLIDVPYEEDTALRNNLPEPPQTPSPTATYSLHHRGDLADDYGFEFLVRISMQMRNLSLPKCIIPIVVISLPSPSSRRGSQVLAEEDRLSRYVDAGAAHVMVSPLSKHDVQALAIQAYRQAKEVNKEEPFVSERPARKLSWVGVEVSQPYAYMREAMVSELMKGICSREYAALSGGIDASEPREPCEPHIPQQRLKEIATAVGTWQFSAHNFTDDELLYAALMMLEHALEMSELEKWRISRHDLLRYLNACRQAYNHFVLYHNFRHIVDVLQAAFHFLTRIGTIPWFPKSASPPTATQPSLLSSILTPLDALTLLISAIGHDVGHPGVNNAFLVALNSPLAQLYNDRSVLESFHCAAYSQILRRFWPAAFSDIEMRKKMIGNILSTDMGLHFKYIEHLAALEQRTVQGTQPQPADRDLLCELLIKCADISNVARVFATARDWAEILTREFSAQGTMETELDMQTCLFGGPPKLNDDQALAKSQVSFMSVFAHPLFSHVRNVLPAMQFSVDILDQNKSMWQQMLIPGAECPCGGVDSCLCSRTGEKARRDMPRELDIPPRSATEASTAATADELTGTSYPYTQPTQLSPPSTGPVPCAAHSEETDDPFSRPSTAVSSSKSSVQQPKSQGLGAVGVAATTPTTASHHDHDDPDPSERGRGSLETDMAKRKFDPPPTAILPHRRPTPRAASAHHLRNSDRSLSPSPPPLPQISHSSGNGATAEMGVGVGGVGKPNGAMKTFAASDTDVTYLTAGVDNGARKSGMVGREGEKTKPEPAISRGGERKKTWLAGRSRGEPLPQQPQQGQRLGVAAGLRRLWRRRRDGTPAADEKERRKEVRLEGGGKG